MAAWNSERRLSRLDMDLGSAADRRSACLVDKLPSLFRRGRVQASFLAVPASANRGLRGWCGVVQRGRVDFLAGAGDRGGFSFCAAAVRVGGVVPAKVG